MKNVTPEGTVMELRSLFHTFLKRHRNGLAFLLFTSLSHVFKVAQAMYFPYSQGHFCPHVMKITGLKVEGKIVICHEDRR